MIQTLLLGLGIALAIEGIAYALAPGGMKSLIEMVRNSNDDQLRAAGLVALLLGLGMVWLATRGSA